MQHSKDIVDSEYLRLIRNLGNKTALSVYLILLDLSKKLKPSEPLTVSHEKLARMLNSSIRTSIRAIQYLDKKGFIEVSNAPFKANEIIINLNVFNEMQEKRTEASNFDEKELENEKINVGKVILLSVILGLLSFNAFAFDNNYYFSIKFGSNIATSLKHSDFSKLQRNLSNANDIRFNYKNSFNGILAFGYQYNDFRYEISGNYLFSKYKRIKSFNATRVTSSITKPGYTEIISVLGNIYYDCNWLDGWVIPYIGLGGGIGQVKNKISIQHLGQNQKIRAKNKVAVYQGTLGLTFNLTESVAATLDYRHLITTKIKSINKNFHCHLINLGLTYRF